MKVFSVFGVSKTGKTSSVAAIICELRKRGHSVGSVKDIHFEGFAVDREGSDTWQHRQAGAQLVTARGVSETDLFFPGRLSLVQVLALYDHDFVVLEGENGFCGPGILTAKNTDEIDARMHERIFAITGCISEECTEYAGLPIINSLKEASRLADLIEQSVPEWLGQREWLLPEKEHVGTNNRFR